METNDSVEVKSEVKSEEYTPLEMPDVVPGAASVDYPEINEFLQKQGCLDIRRKMCWKKCSG